MRSERSQATALAPFCGKAVAFPPRCFISAIQSDNGPIDNFSPEMSAARPVTQGRRRWTRYG